MQFTEITTGESREMPSKIVAYGVPKIGKSRFAASFPDPFFINIEDGLNYIGKKVRATPKLHDYDAVMGWLMHIYDAEVGAFTCGRLVVDSLDWAESLARAKVEGLHNGKSIKDQAYKPFSYGAGQSLVDEEVMRLFRALDKIYERHAIPALLIAHSSIKTLDLPTKDPYSKYELKVSKAVAAKAAEWADLILFADYSFHVTTEGKTSEPKPVFLAGGSAAYTGGGRMLLRNEVPLNYEQLKEEICQ